MDVIRFVRLQTESMKRESKCSKYMLTLQTLRLIEKCVPCTEPETSKKGFMK